MLQSLSSADMELLGQSVDILKIWAAIGRVAFQRGEWDGHFHRWCVTVHLLPATYNGLSDDNLW